MGYSKQEENVDLAAALFAVLGVSVPHKYELEPKAKELAGLLNDRTKVLKEIVVLCGEPQTPKAMYLAARACSWLGKSHADKAVQYATEYLYSQGWEELPRRITEENGVLIDYGAVSKAEVLMDLSRAESARNRPAAALEACKEAYRMQSGNAMYAIKVAEQIQRVNGLQEALAFLRAQERAGYYEPVKYYDSQGNVCYNDTFRQLVQSEIRKLEAQE